MMLRSNSALLYGRRFLLVRLLRRCGNVAAILELDENLSKYFKVRP